MHCTQPAQSGLSKILTGQGVNKMYSEKAQFPLANAEKLRLRERLCCGPRSQVITEDRIKSSRHSRRCVKAKTNSANTYNQMFNHLIINQLKLQHCVLISAQITLLNFSFMAATNEPQSFSV